VLQQQGAVGYVTVTFTALWDAGKGVKVCWPRLAL
jgi:hypothetical protein